MQKSFQYILYGLCAGILITTAGFALEPALLKATSPNQPSAPTAVVPPGVLNLQDSFANVAEVVKPTVVSVSTIQEEQQSQAPQFFFGDPFDQFFHQFFPGQSRRGSPEMQPQPRRFRLQGMGSGVIINADGLVLTNEHVVHDADEIKVIVYYSKNNKKEYKAKVIGKDPRTDLALVKIKTGQKLPFAKLGDSDRVRIGDWAIAIGSPFGLEQTFTVGVISANRQRLSVEGHQYQGMIQTDAAINRGNSGGPLLNIHGEVIGINTAIYAPTGVFSGVGFAIPINQAKDIIHELETKGHVVRGWLGVELAPEITPAMVKAFGLSNAQGALINSVTPGTPAEKAGLQRGDVVVSFNGKPVQSSDDLQKWVTHADPKDRITLDVIRSRERKTFKVVLGERPESVDLQGGRPPAGGSEHPGGKDILDATVAPLTPELAQQFGQPQDAKGVIVLDVKDGGTADEMGLLTGDIIRQVNQKPTPDVESLQKALSGIDLKEGIVLDILRHGRPMYLSYSKS